MQRSFPNHINIVKAFPFVSLETYFNWYCTYDWERKKKQRVNTKNMQKRNLCGNM